MPSFLSFFPFTLSKADSAERQLVNRAGIFPWNWRVLGSTEGPSTLKVIHPLKGMLMDDGKHIGIVEALYDSKGRHPRLWGHDSSEKHRNRGPKL